MSLIKELEELIQEVRDMRESGVSREEAIEYLRKQCRIRRGYAAIANEVYGPEQSVDE